MTKIHSPLYQIAPRVILTLLYLIALRTVKHFDRLFDVKRWNIIARWTLPPSPVLLEKYTEREKNRSNNFPSIPFLLLNIPPPPPPPYVSLAPLLHGSKFYALLVKIINVEQISMESLELMGFDSIAPKKRAF